MDEAAECGAEVWPNVHPYRGTGADLDRAGPPQGGIVGQPAGMSATSPRRHRGADFDAAYASAQCAVAAADAVLKGEREAYALCRPPGHHAYRDRACGFCFLNNAAIAAEHLRSRFARVAILDFDTHHGDGTQAIFYDRGDVLVASTHTDPTELLPFLFGLRLTRPGAARERARTSTCRCRRAPTMRPTSRPASGSPTRPVASAPRLWCSPQAGTRTGTIRPRGSP